VGCFFFSLFLSFVFFFFFVGCFLLLSSFFFELSSLEKAFPASGKLSLRNLASLWEGADAFPVSFEEEVADSRTLSTEKPPADSLSAGEDSIASEAPSSPP